MNEQAGSSGSEEKKPDLHIVGADGEPVKKEEQVEQKQPIFSGAITPDGKMVMSIDLARISECKDTELMDRFVGFMERHKEIAISHVGMMRQERARFMAEVQKVQQKNGFQKLMNKIRGGR